MRVEARRKALLAGVVSAALVGTVAFYWNDLKDLYNKRNPKCGCDESLESPGVLKAFMRYGDNVVKVPVRDVGGRAVFEGDIVLGRIGEVGLEASRIEGAGGAVAINRYFQQLRSMGRDDAAIERESVRIFGHRGVAKPWPGNTVYYYFEVDDDELESIVGTALAHWSKETKLVFRQLEGMPRGVRFIRFRRAAGDCFWDQKQNIASVSAGCVRHEVGHALGLLHEHTRSDRNDFVTINKKNIKKTACEFFKVNPIKEHRCGNYDLKSIVHYSSFDFACNGGAAMVTKSNKKIKYNYDFISPGDVATVLAIQAGKPCS